MSVENPVERLGAWNSVKERAFSGESFLLDGGPGTGKTTLACHLVAHALNTNVTKRGGDACSHWTPTLVLTPDRSRAEHVDMKIARTLSGENGNLFKTVGSHRIIRSLTSYADLIVGLWRVEREVPLPRLPFTSGAREDAWFDTYLKRIAREGNSKYSEKVLNSAAFRMEIRNIVARSGEVGLEPKDLAELANQFVQPIWALAATAYREYAGTGHIPFTPETLHVDSARLPWVGASVLRDWEQLAPNMGVKAPMPVPHLLIVDDVQDLPSSATPLIVEAARHAQQVVLLSSPHSATTHFRGGRPDLGNEIAERLNLNKIVLRQNLRSTFNVAQVGEEVTSWIDPRISTATKGSFEKNLTATLAATETKRDTLIAQTLRHYHLESGEPWEKMAVVVRQSQDIEPIRRRLARFEVPLGAQNRPTHLATEPMCAALLNVLKFGGELHGFSSENIVPQREVAGQNSEESELAKLGLAQRSARALLNSPLVNVDRLSVFQLMRDLRALDHQIDIEFGTVGLLEASETVFSKLEAGGKGNQTEVLKAVRKARSIWRLAQKSALEGAQVGLWNIWEAAGVADSLRERAMSLGSEKVMSREMAANTLDSVRALFRKADFWQQEKLQTAPKGACDANAYTFACETLSQSVSVDSLARGGIAEPGVAVVTASQAAGREWEIVCIVGPQLGAWPAGGVDSLAQLDRLRIIVDDAMKRGWTGQTPIKDYIPDVGVGRATNFRQSRIERTRNDARMFLSAVTRARSGLHFFAVESENQAGSPFLRALVEAELVPALHSSDGEPIYGRENCDLNLQSLVAALRRQLVDPEVGNTVRSEAARLLALMSIQGVRGASPETWVGFGSISTDKPVLELGKVPLSPSKLETAEECPLKWFFYFVQGEDRETGDQLTVFTKAVLGKLVHEIAETLPKGSSQEMCEALEKKWNKLGLTEGTHWNKHWKAEAMNMVKRVACHVSAWEGEVKVEEKMRIELGNGVVFGRMDRLELVGENSARVVDIKTGAAITQKKAETNRQLLAYQLGLSELGYESAGAALLQVSNDSLGKRFVTQEPLNGEEMDSCRQELANLATTLSGATYRAKPDSWRCRTCPFTKSCPAMQGV